MKTTELKEIIEFLKNELKLEISSAQEKKLFDKFIDTKDVTNLVLWRDRFVVTEDVTNLVLWRCVCETNERHPDTYERQGLITKEEYKNIKNANIKPDEDICFDEIAEYVELHCYFKDISFTEDSFQILDFCNQNEDDYPLLDYLDYLLEDEDDDDEDL